MGEEMAPSGQEQEEPRSKQLLFFVVFALIVLVVAWLLLSYFGSGDSDDTADVGDLAVVYVPNVLGLTEDEAEFALEEAGFETESMPLRDQYADPDTVIVQSPEGGTEAAPGITVTIEIAMWDGSGSGVLPPGSEVSTALVVPDVLGRSQASAESVIDSNGFVPRVSKAYDRYVPAGKVVSQSPTGRTRAAFGTEVRIVVSLGAIPPAAATVPDVVGLTESAARARAEAAGLELWVIPRLSPPATLDRVWQQWPVPGTRVEASSRVNAIIGTD